jgi:hypothetical protein
MRADGQHAGDRSRDGVAGAALIAGGGHHQRVGLGSGLQGCAQVMRERQRVSLLRGADVDDVGVALEGGADAGGQLTLGADLLSAGGRGGKDRNGNRGCSLAPAPA